MFLRVSRLIPFVHRGRASVEDLDTHVPVEVVPEDEVPLKEEVQYIMPPRCDDIAEPSPLPPAVQTSASRLVR